MSGTNYGLNENLKYYEIELDSLDNSNSYSSDYAGTDWPRFRLTSPINNIAALKVLEAQIPFSYYIINSQNNTFLLNESVGNVDKTVTVPVGNYDATTLADALGAALYSASSNGYTYTVTYKQSTGKMTITSSGGNLFKFTFGLSTNSGNTNPRLFLGFPGGETISNTSGVLITPNILRITGPDYLYLNSNTIGSDCNLYLPEGAVNISKNGQGCQMCKIPVNCMPGSTIFWQGKYS